MDDCDHSKADYETTPKGSKSWTFKSTGSAVIFDEDLCDIGSYKIELQNNLAMQPDDLRMKYETRTTHDQLSPILEDECEYKENQKHEWHRGVNSWRKINFNNVETYNGTSIETQLKDLFIKDEAGDYKNESLILERGKSRLIKEYEKAIDEIRRKDEMVLELEKKLQQYEFNDLECKSAIINETESLCVDTVIEPEYDTLSLFKLFMDVIMEKQKEVISVYENKLSKKREKMNVMKSKLSNLESLKNSLLEQCALDSPDRLNKNEKICNREGNNDQLDSKKNENIEENTSFHRLFNKLTDKLKDKTEENTRLLDELVAKTDKIDEQNKLYSACKSDLNELQTSYNSLLKENETLENTIAKFKEIERDALDNLSNAYQSITDLNMLLTMRNSEVSELKNTVDTLHKRLCDLTDEYNETRCSLLAVQNDLMLSKKQEEENVIYKDKYKNLRDQIIHLDKIIEKENCIPDPASLNSSQVFTETPMVNLIERISAAYKQGVCDTALQEKIVSTLLLQISDSKKENELYLQRCNDYDCLKTKFDQSVNECHELLSTNEQLMRTITDLNSHIMKETEKYNKISGLLKICTEENSKYKEILRPAISILSNMQSQFIELCNSVPSAKKIADKARHFLMLEKRNIKISSDKCNKLLNGYSKLCNHLAEQTVLNDEQMDRAIFQDIKEFITDLSKQTLINIQIETVNTELFFKVANHRLQSQKLEIIKYQNELENLKKEKLEFTEKQQTHHLENENQRLYSKILDLETSLSQLKSELNYANNSCSTLQLKIEQITGAHKNEISEFREKLENEERKNHKLKTEIRILQRLAEDEMTHAYLGRNNQYTQTVDVIVTNPNSPKITDGAQLSLKIEKLSKEKAFLKELCRRRNTTISNQQQEINKLQALTSLSKRMTGKRSG